MCGSLNLSIKFKLDATSSMSTLERKSLKLIPFTQYRPELSPKFGGFYGNATITLEFDPIYSISALWWLSYLSALWYPLWFPLSTRNGFQRLDKIKDSSRQSKQLEELTGKMRECKRYGKTSARFFAHVGASLVAL